MGINVIWTFELSALSSWVGMMSGLEYVLDSRSEEKTVSEKYEDRKLGRSVCCYSVCLL